MVGTAHRKKKKKPPLAGLIGIPYHVRGSQAPVRGLISPLTISVETLFLHSIGEPTFCLVIKIPFKKISISLLEVFISVRRSF